MVRIVSLDILDLLPFPSGVLFALKEKTNQNRDKISFYSYDYTANSISTVTRNAFLLTKFGPSFMRIASQLNDHISCETTRMENGSLFLIYSSGETGLFDDKGRLLKTGDIHYRGAPARDAAADGSFIWSVVSDRNLIVKYSTVQNRITMRIGGDNSSAFSAPCAVCSDDTYLYVCNSGDCKIKRVNMKSFAVEDLKQFDEPVYKYIRHEDREFVVLASGVYML